MTALSPVPNATGQLVLPEAAATPDGGTPPAWAQLGFTVAATSIIWVAVLIAAAGFVWAALPVAVLAVGIFAGAVLPDLLGSRWDAQRAEQDAEDAA